MLSNFPIWPLIDDSVPNPTVEDNGTESPICDDERGFIPPITIPTNNATTTTKLSGAPRRHHCHAATNKEVLSEALAKEDVPGADHLAQHVLSQTPPLVLVVPRLWILTLLPQARQNHLRSSTIARINRYSLWSATQSRSQIPLWNLWPTRLWMQLHGPRGLPH